MNHTSFKTIKWIKSQQKRDKNMQKIFQGKVEGEVVFYDEFRKNMATSF